MKKIENFMLPKHTNELYTKSAKTSGAECIRFGFCV